MDPILSVLDTLERGTPVTAACAPDTTATHWRLTSLPH
jgi:hypothetical protein